MALALRLAAHGTLVIAEPTAVSTSVAIVNCRVDRAPPQMESVLPLSRLVCEFLFITSRAFMVISVELTTHRILAKGV